MYLFGVHEDMEVNDEPFNDSVARNNAVTESIKDRFAFTPGFALAHNDDFTDDNGDE